MLLVADVAKSLAERESSLFTGKDLFQAQREADYAGRLYTPEQVAQFVNDLRKDGFQDKIIYYYINALISGPLTHARYAVGNMINVLAKPLLITPVSAVAGRVGEAVGLQAPGDRVYMREAGAELYAIIKGSQDGIKAAVEAMKTGVSPPLPGERLVMHEIQAPPADRRLDRVRHWLARQGRSGHP